MATLTQKIYGGKELFGHNALCDQTLRLVNNIAHTDIYTVADGALLTTTPSHYTLFALDGWHSSASAAFSFA